MGSACRVLVAGGNATRLARQGRTRVQELETRWSRFLDESEVSCLNRSEGLLCVVSDDTFDLVARSVEAWERTGGRFDPTVLPSVELLGYDRDFAAVSDAPPAPAAEAAAAPGCAGIELFPSIPAVRLPAGVQLDPGGIGKGLAGDRVAAELMAGGADGVLVDLGGDVVVAGVSPTGRQWDVAIEDPFDHDAELLRVRFDRGAVATSTTLIKRWRCGHREVHHVIDPTTGACTTAAVAATAVAGAGWWAEAVATASLVKGTALRDADAWVLTVDERGRLHTDLEHGAATA
jgi:thiamine biosynthesis lipoprotein